MTSQIQDIKNAVDIVQIIGERVTLARSGKNLRGLCPFHSEKTPSFFVTPDLQRYKCFGCAKSGDVLTFLQEYESLTFGEALQTLADRVGIKLEQHSFTPEDQHRNRLHEVLHLASEYFHYILTKHEAGEKARQYLKERGVSNDAIKTFTLGYSLDSWDALQKYLIGKKQYTQKELLDAGLIIQKTSGSGYYDRFRGRVMFPLTTPQGKIVGFSGRTLEKDVKEAKYINSPETTLYHKSELLFGYSQLKNFIRKEEEVFVVEGELDAISSYQAEVKNVVAIKGSAFTASQFRLLSRSVKRVIFALDADDAGVEATRRAITTAKDFELFLRVLPLIGGKDPDAIAKDNPKIWREMTKKTIPVYEFLLSAIFKKFDVKTAEGKQGATNEIVKVLSEIQHAVERSHYLQYVAEELHVKEEVIEEELEKYQRKQSLQMYKPIKRDTEKPIESVTVHNVVENHVLKLLLHAESEDVEVFAKEVDANLFSTLALKNLLQKVIEFTAKQDFDISKFSAYLPDELQTVLSDLYLTDVILTHTERKEWDLAVERLKDKNRTAQMQQLNQKIAEMEKILDRTVEQEAQLTELMNEFKRISAN